MYWTLQILVSLLLVNFGHSDPLQLFAVDNANYSINQFCRCDAACVKIGDCCLDCPNAMVTLDAISLKTRCSNVPNISRPLMVTYGCPDNYPDAELVSNCSATGFFMSTEFYVDQDGLLYANQDCAACNALLKMSPHRLQTNARSVNQELRYCHPSVEFCTIPGIKMWNRSLSDLCGRFSAPVMSMKNRNLIYKNVFCALCNGVPLERLTPFTSTENANNHFSYYLLNIGNEGGEWHKKDNRPGPLKLVNEIPAAFSILLNFGLDGKEDMMFSSSNAERLRRKQRGCGRDFIWDPFSEICRQLFCSVEYVLVDFNCIPNNTYHQNDGSNPADLNIFDTEAQMAELRLSMKASVNELFIYHNQTGDWKRLQADLEKSLSNFYKISDDRIVNMNLTTEVPDFEDPFSNILGVNGTGDFIDDLERLLNELEASQKVTFTASFHLHENKNPEKAEPSVSKVVGKMVSSVSTGTFEIYIQNVKTRVFAIHQNSTTLESWCSSKTGAKRAVYWNDEFQLILHQNSSANENWVKEVYINKSSKTYAKGNFVANILFQGIEREDQKVNVSGFVIVCEQSNLSPSCSRVRLQPDEFEILPNGTVAYYGNNSQYLNLTVFEPATNDSIFVCFDSRSIIESMSFTIKFDPTQAMVSLILLCLSITSLAIVLMTYCLFSELRNLPGCNTLNLALSLLGGQLTFLLSQRGGIQGNLCEALGALVHYLILTSFLWMNIMAYDLYKTFGYGTVLTRIRPKGKYLPIYLAYAYATPGIIVGLSLYLNSFDNPIQPMYGGNMSCWINNPLAGFLLFAAPIAVVLLINLVLYILTISSISDIHNKIETKTKPKSGKRDVQLYIRIATTMGFTWIFGFLAAILRQPLGSKYEAVSESLVYLFIVFNCLQGVFVFCAFVCNKRVYTLYRKVIFTFNNTRIAKCSRCGSTFCVCKAKTAMRRSSSTDTNLSVLSTDDLHPSSEP